MKYAFTIPALPPSVNRIWHYGSGRCYKDKKCEEFYWLCVPHLPKLKSPIIFPVEVSLIFTFPSQKKMERADTDNRIKVILDCLANQGVLLNDNLVYKITAEKKTGVAEATSVLITSYLPVE